MPVVLIACLVGVSTASATQKGAFERHEGWVTAPESPGLGIEPNMQVLGKPVMTFSHLA